jgi:Fur family ferric uptake transcriptional regulator
MGIASPPPTADGLAMTKQRKPNTNSAIPTGNLTFIPSSSIIENYYQLQVDMRLTANRIAGILREHGHKLTPQRHTVLRVIASSQDHLTPEDIYEKSRLADPGIGLVTIYRTLDLLTRLGLVCRVHLKEGCRSYMMRRPLEHHHHLVCSNCGRVIDFTSCNLGEMEEKLSKESGFDIKGHLLEFYGICSSCIIKSSA